MLATMRPAATTQFSSHHTSHPGGASTAASTSRPPSRAASVASNSSTSSPVKLSTSNRSNKRNGTRSGLNPKKASSSAASQPQPTNSSSNTPGLISLSRPVDPASSSPRTANKTASKGQRKESKKQQAANAAAEYPEAVSAADESLLSKSAPLPATAAPKHKKKAAGAATSGVAAADNAPSALTWQQQLLGVGASSDAKKGKANVVDRAKSLTWQQELFNASNHAKRGPHFDVFADARDAETFGSGGEDNGGGGGGASRKNSRNNNKAVKADLTLDDVFASGGPLNQPRRNANGAGSHNPSTPSKPTRNKHANASPAHHLAIPGGGSSSDSNDAAYAGPDFHNSPSAASLPAPKFMSKKQHQASSSSSSLLPAKPSSLRQNSSSDEAGSSSSSSDAEADSSSLDIERQKRSSQRGVTAPPTTNASQTHNANGMNKSATIENLLAQMMGGSSLTMKQ